MRPITSNSSGWPTSPPPTCAMAARHGFADRGGQSIVPPDRAAMSPLEVSVYNYEYPDQTQWRVGYVVPAEDLACGG